MVRDDLENLLGWTVCRKAACSILKNSCGDHNPVADMLLLKKGKSKPALLCTDLLYLNLFYLNLYSVVYGAAQESPGPDPKAEPFKRTEPCSAESPE